MKIPIFLCIAAIIIFTGIGIYRSTRSSTTYKIIESQRPFLNAQHSTWQRPAGPPKIALQAGHWKNNELPDELENLRISSGGTNANDINEWEVNLTIAQKTADILCSHGMHVDVLPATVPEEYWADVFVAIHADGNENPSVFGYKVAAPRRDMTGHAKQLASLLEQEYGKATNLSTDPNITRDMRGYYAFNWRKYNHSIHPMTAAAIIETGFLTNAHDRSIIVQQTDTAAKGIADGIIAYVQSQHIDEQ